MVDDLFIIMQSTTLHVHKQIVLLLKKGNLNVRYIDSNIDWIKI